MKKYWLLIGLCIVSLGLGGCGDEEEQPVAEEKAGAVITEEVTESEPSLGGVSVEPSVVEKLSGDTVTGNGEYFIKVGDRIYFREYEKDALCEPVMGGDFRSYFIEDSTKKICYVKKGDTKVHDAFYDTGFGELYYYDGLFYLKDDLGTYTITKDGSEKEYLNLGEDMASFELIYDHYMFYSDLVTDTVSLFVKDLDTEDEGTAVYDLDIENEAGWPVISQAEVHGDSVYIGVEYIDGTGAFFQGGEVVKCPLDGSDTEGEVIKNIGWDADDGDDGGDLLAMKYFSVDDDGEVKTYYHLPGSVWIDMGDLYIANDDGEGLLYMEDFERDPIGGVYERTEQVCMLDGEVFAINNLMIRSPENDIGWREYYKDVRSAYLKIDTDDNLHELCSQELPPENTEGFIYLLKDRGENGEYLVFYEPVVSVSREEPELCELYGLDPSDPDLFFDDYELVQPFNGYGYVYSLSDDFTAQTVDFESDTFSKEEDLDGFLDYIGNTDHTFMELSIDDMEFDEYSNMYEGPVDDWDNDIYYWSLFGKISFNEDYSAIDRFVEIYLP